MAWKKWREWKRYSRHVNIIIYTAVIQNFRREKHTSEMYEQSIMKKKNTFLPKKKKDFSSSHDENSKHERVCTNSLEYSLCLIESKINIFSSSGFIFFRFLWGLQWIVTKLTPFTLSLN